MSVPVPRPGSADDAIALAVAELAVPIAAHDGPGPLVRLGRALTATRRRTTALVVWAVAVAAIVLAAMPATVDVSTSLGPATVDCGLEVFVSGQPDHAVDSACRSAEASHLAIALLAGGVVVAGLLVLALAAPALLRGEPVDRAALRARVRGRRVALGAVLAVAGVAAALALVPTTVEASQPGGVTSVSCGLDAYYAGYPDAAVDQACTRSLRTRAHVLEAAVVVGGIALAVVAWQAADDPERRRRLRARAPVAVAAVLGIVAVGALLRPVPVAVQQADGSSIVADCGLDVLVAGHPDAVVEHACAKKAGRFALAGGALVLVATVGSVAWLQERRRTAPEPTRPFGVPA